MSVIVTKFRRGNDQDFAYAGEHQDRQGIEDHWLVIDRQKLLVHGERHWMEARARTTGKNDTLHIPPFKQPGRSCEAKCDVVARAAMTLHSASLQ